MSPRAAKSLRKAKRVKPVRVKPEPVRTPQCCVKVDPPQHNKDWRRVKPVRARYEKLRPHFDPGRCQLESTVAIDGKYYCTGHAGKIALGLWLSGELVRK